LKKFDGRLLRRGERGREGSGGFEFRAVFELDVFFMLEEVDERRGSGAGHGDDDDDGEGFDAISFDLGAVFLLVLLFRGSDSISSSSSDGSEARLLVPRRLRSCCRSLGDVFLLFCSKRGSSRSDSNGKARLLLVSLFLFLPFLFLPALPPRLPPPRVPAPAPLRPRLLRQLR